MYKDLNKYERGLLSKLLEKPFPGRDEINKQIKYAKVRVIDEYGDNYGSLEFELQTDLKSPVEQRVPVGGIAHDIDNVPIEILLHVVDGKVKELEIVKADGSAIKAFPSIEEINTKVRQ